MNPLSTLPLVALLAATSLTAQTQRGIFLLDRSASMLASAPGGGGSRCDKSLDWIDADLAAFFGGGAPTEALIVEFDTDPGYYRVLGGGWILDEATARATAATSTTCAGSATQLARAICQTVSDMRGRVAVSPPELFCPMSFYFYSDGGENSSSGSCAGGNDVNAATGRCPGDSFHIGPEFEFDGAGMTSWQRHACDNIHSLVTTAPTGCTVPLVVYARKFNELAEGTSASTTDVFRFLDSMAYSTGGSSISVLDSEPVVVPAGNPVQIVDAGCTTQSGENPLLIPLGFARFGNSFGMRVAGTTLPLRLQLIGLNLQLPGLDLAGLGAPGCRVVVEPLVTFPSGLLPAFSVPNDQSVIGSEIHFQGIAAAFDLSDLATTNAITMTVQP